jgi:GntP family gluconate:H+ symporter
MNGKLSDENIGVPKGSLLGQNSLMGFVRLINVLVFATPSAALIIVHVNDSFFWVVTGFSKMDVASGYRTVSVLSAVMGLTAFAMISLVGPILLGL